MARPKEHNIHRNLWNTPISENGQFKSDLFAAMNWTTMNYALNNDAIKSNGTYISFHKCQQSLIKYMSILVNQYKDILNILDIENVPFTTSDIITNEKIKKKLSKLHNAIQALPTDVSTNRSKLSQITTCDLFDFLKKIYDVGISKNDLENLFGKNYGNDILSISELSYFSPKDNLSTRCSDNIVLFNLAIYTYVEEESTSKRLPFRIFQGNLYPDILSNYSTDKKPIDNLSGIWNYLKTLSPRTMPLSDECLYSLLFYCHTANLYHQLNRLIQSCENLLSSLSSLIQKKTVSELQMYCQPDQKRFSFE